MDSILTSIKKLLGITEEYEHFDADLIMHINSVFAILTQIGVGPSTGFSISDDSAIWNDFITNVTQLEAVKIYMSTKVKLAFDNSTLSSAVIAAMERQTAELEWRLSVMADTDTSTTVPIESDGITLKDKTYGGTYELYVDDGKLKMDKK